MTKQDKNPGPHELAGIILLSISTLLACSLITYDWHDIRFFYKVTGTAPPLHNLVGHFGAYLAFIVYQLIGWSANLLPILTLYLSMSCFLRNDFRVQPGLWWMLLFVLSVSAVTQIAGWGAVSWMKKNNNLYGVGGLWGCFVVRMCFQALFGKGGSLLIFLPAMFTGLYMAMQINPREMYVQIKEKKEERKKQRREEALRSGDIKEVLRTREEEIAERQRLIERELARQSRGAKPASTVVSSSPAKPEKREEPVKPAAPARESAKESAKETAKAPARETPREPARTAPKESAKAPPPAAPDAPIGELATPIGATNVTDPSTASAPAPQPAPAEPPREIRVPRTTEKASRRTTIRPVVVGNYRLPGSDLLSSTKQTIAENKDTIALKAALIQTTLKDFDIDVQIGTITPGATITRYEVIPSPGVKVEKITGLQNNLTLALKTERVNILAPVAGKGTVGIEVANTAREAVLIREVIESAEFQSSRAKIPLAVGKDVYGKTLVSDLADMPHFLIAGSTGSGKSVCINCLVASMLFKFSPEDLRLILIDPKRVELQDYNELPHLVVPVVCEPKKVILALRWVVREMEMRYKIMAKVGVRNVAAFNARARQAKTAKSAEVEDLGSLKKSFETGREAKQALLIPEDEIAIPDKIPYIVIIIDELADLMLTAPVDAEDAITRITQMARAAGIHLIVATQTPRADIVTGIIKTNLPSKIAFKVATKIDSRVILDANGAETLLGKGDLLYKASDSGTQQRAQGAFISDEEVKRLVAFCSRQAEPQYDMEMQERLSKPASSVETEGDEEDEELVQKCIEVIRQENRASTSLLQRRLRLGYTRAARIMDLLEQRGVVGPSQGAKDREILLKLDGSPPGSTI
jgi:S-DNA-T family DNA segregation ATPase FtsK/SpoIIIE